MGLGRWLCLSAHCTQAGKLQSRLGRCRQKTWGEGGCPSETNADHWGSGRNDHQCVARQKSLLGRSSEGQNRKENWCLCFHGLHFYKWHKPSLCTAEPLKPRVAVAGLWPSGHGAQIITLRMASFLICLFTALLHGGLTLFVYSFEKSYLHMSICLSIWLYVCVGTICMSGALRGRASSTLKHWASLQPCAHSSYIAWKDSVVECERIQPAVDIALYK